jgi:hypothetical protein
MEFLYMLNQKDKERFARDAAKIREKKQKKLARQQERMNQPRPW